MIQITQKRMNSLVILPGQRLQVPAKYLLRGWSDVAVHHKKQDVDADYPNNANAPVAFKRQFLTYSRFAETSGLVGRSGRDETAALRAAKKSLQDPPSK